MSIELNCPHCQKHYTVPDEMATKKVKCKACDGVFRVPAETMPPPPETENEPSGSDIESHGSQEAGDENGGDGKQNGAVTALRFMAWFSLFIGVAVSISLFATSDSGYGETNTLAIISALVSLFVSFLVCAFFLVVCSMADNLIHIRQKLESMDSTS